VDRDVCLWSAVRNRRTGRCATWLVEALVRLTVTVLAAAFRRITVIECFVLRLVERENAEPGKLRLILVPLGGSNAMASVLVEVEAMTATNATISSKPVVFLYKPIEKPQLILLGYTEQVYQRPLEFIHDTCLVFLYAGELGSQDASFLTVVLLVLTISYRVRLCASRCLSHRVLCGRGLALPLFNAE
jgi:hypothetical protein